jgi:predicted secreted hydrolase
MGTALLAVWAALLGGGCLDGALVGSGTAGGVSPVSIERAASPLRLAIASRAGTGDPAGRAAAVMPMQSGAAPAREAGGAVTAAGWRQAGSGHAWRFPRDHGSHPEYRIEWWYYTGNLASDRGRRFGYQVTFFRVGVDLAPENPSRWAVRDLFMAHLAVTDLGTGRHLVAERLDRGGLGWAGAREGTLDVWNGDWRASLDGGGHRLEVIDRSFGVDLRLEPGKGPTLHGENGLSRKGPSAGNASQYYSMTRMPTTGRVRLDGEWVDVTGASWMDHEFGTTFLEPGQVGWDWFSLQLEDGADLMVFQLRRADGRPDDHSAGTWVDGGGAVTALQGRDVRLVPGRRWTSPASGAAYPVEWRVELPGRQASLAVTAALDAQELDTAASTGVTYWEGAVTVTGRIGSRQVRGRGYLEMTGYSGRPMSEVFR